jgi:hypothetical protein
MDSVVDDNNKVMEHGIKALLGKEEYDPAEKIKVCTHISDGFVYDDTPVFTTLQCARCGLQYDVLKATGMIM